MTTELHDAEGSVLQFCESCQPPDEREGQEMKPCEWREDTGIDPAAWLCAECYAEWDAQPWKAQP